MYIPSAFAETNPDTLHEFMEHHSFATMISVDGNQVVTTQVPLLLDRANQQLLGHVARANPHGQLLDGRPITCLFHGPHAYISPTWIAVRNSVPTWNYVTVEVRGTVRLEPDPDRCLDILRTTVDTYESSLPVPWSIDMPEPEFIEKLVAAIVAFRIDIEQIEGKWKLNQNHDAVRRQRVIAALQAGGAIDQLEIAGLMQATLPSE